MKRCVTVYYLIMVPTLIFKEDPPSDGLPRYHKWMTLNNVGPYDGRSDINLWIEKFEMYMAELWCDTDKYRLPWFISLVHHLPFLNNPMDATSCSYQHWKNMLHTAFVHLSVPVHSGVD